MKDGDDFAAFKRRPCALTNAQLDVDRWHEDVLGVEMPEDPCLPADIGQRSTLLSEEVAEALEALADRDLPQIIKEHLDVIWTALRTLSGCGVAVEPFWRQLLASNMSKAGAGFDANGKWQKGSNYVPPDIEGELRRQGWEPAR